MVQYPTFQVQYTSSCIGSHPTDGPNCLSHLNIAPIVFIVGSMPSKSDKWKIRKGHVQGLSILSAVLTLTTKWLFGIVIRKLITMQIPIVGDYDTKPMFDVIFLESLSFEMTLGLAAASTILVALSYAETTSLALLRSAKTGRKLRSRILQAVVGPHNSRMASAVDSSGYKANELIVKINLIENFVAYDEHGLTMHRATLAMALVLSFIFIWFGGVIAVAMAVCSKFFDHMFDRARSKYRHRIERNTDRANAQFLDVIKNGGKVKIILDGGQRNLEFVRSGTRK